MGISGFFSPQRWLVSTWVAGECSLQAAVIHQQVTTSQKFPIKSSGD
jgi:hypothetical protein